MNDHTPFDGLIRGQAFDRCGKMGRKMAICGCSRKLKQYAVAVIAGTALVSPQAPAAEAKATKDQAANYQPAHNPVQCPHIPADLDPIPTCRDKQATCVGTEGNDVILGTDGDDVIIAGPGHDVVHADVGNDTVCGGPGNDSLMGAAGEDSMYGGPGDDRLFGGKDPDLLHGGPGNFDVLWGGPGSDNLDGGHGSHDICMLQREMGDINPEGCNTIYPPPGYLHDQEPDPGVLKKAEPLKLKK